MAHLVRTSLAGVVGVGRAYLHLQDCRASNLKIFTAGLKTYVIPPDYSDVVFPEKPKLKFLEKAPNVSKPQKMPRNLDDIRGPASKGNTFTIGQYGIVAFGGGYLHWGHFEMMRLTINRKMDPQTTFAVWGVEAPNKSITRKGLGQRMGGGKGAIDHYVTPVRSGQLIVELGGKVEMAEVEKVLKQVAKKLPFRAKVFSREDLEAFKKSQAEREQNNQNPWTFKKIVHGNMLGIRRIISPFDYHNHGRYEGKFFLPDRV